MKILIFLFLALPAFAQTAIINKTPSAKITWVAPKAPQGFNFGNLTYTLCLGTEPKKYTQEFQTTALTKVLDNLQFDTIYYVSIKSTNEYGLESDYGQEIMFKITQPRKYIVNLRSQDGGKTWQEFGEVIVPLPIVKGEKYKTKTVIK